MQKWKSKKQKLIAKKESEREKIPWFAGKFVAVEEGNKWSDINVEG